MKTFSATTTINASQETIWNYLTDAQGYPNWDPGVEKIEGTIAQGEKIKAYSKLSPGRAFPVKVTEMVPGRKMVWTGGMPMGLFKGERTFTLIPKEDESIEVTVREEFSGLLLPMFAGKLPDLTKTFEDFVEGLKVVSEGK